MPQTRLVATDGIKAGTSTGTRYGARVSKTHRFYEALQAERETEDELRDHLESLIDAIAPRDAETAYRLRVELADIETRVHRVYATVWQKVEPSLSTESSEMLVALANYARFILLRDCAKWMLGSST